MAALWLVSLVWYIYSLVITPNTGNFATNYITFSQIANHERRTRKCTHVITLGSSRIRIPPCMPFLLPFCVIFLAEGESLGTRLVHDYELCKPCRNASGKRKKNKKKKLSLVMNIIRPHIYSTTLEMLTLCKISKPTNTS